MIYLGEIVDEIKSDLLSGMTYNETRFDDEYIEVKIHAARAHLIAAYLKKFGKFINDAWVQTLDVSFGDRDKNCEYVTFECPNVISTDGMNDGFVYVGHANGLKPFVRIRKGFTTLTRHSIFSKKKDILWDFKHLDQTIEESIRNMECGHTQYFRPTYQSWVQFQHPTYLMIEQNHSMLLNKLKMLM